MKRINLKILLCSVILINVLLVVPFAVAQTVAEWKFLPTPEGIEPIKVSISYPENLSSFTSNNITLFFNATAPKPDSFPNLESNSEGSFDNWVWSYYNASWLSANDNYKDCNISEPFNALNGNVTIQNIPVGNHYLEIGVGGLYLTERTLLTATGYRLFSSASINFTVLPEATPSPYSARISDNYQELFIILIVTMAVAVSVGLILYSKRKNRKMLTQQQKSLKVV